MEEYDENECCVIKSEASRVRTVYVSYHGVLTLEELMMDDPAEQYQRNQGFNFQMT